MPPAEETKLRSRYQPHPAPSIITESDLSRFWAKVSKSDDGCWLWNACLDDKGYGMFKLGGRMWKAQRVSWLLHHSDPAELDVCHHCDTPACIRPDHLFSGTAADNMRDCVRKGRDGAARLRERQILECKNFEFPPLSGERVKMPEDFQWPWKALGYDDAPV